MRDLKFCVKKRKSTSGTSGRSLTQAEREANGRPNVSMAMSSRERDELDRQRGELPRGAYVAWMLRHMAECDDPD